MIHIIKHNLPELTCASTTPHLYIRNHEMHIQNIKAFGILFQSILSLKMHLWEIYQVYKYILKTKAHSLVCRWVVI